MREPQSPQEKTDPKPRPPPPSKVAPRLLLDVFSGIHAPISQAAMEMGLDRFEPFDIMINPEHDILNDDVFHSLLKICWSGLVGLITLAPPCKEYSRLKLRPGGPPALRTPEHMQGVPWNNQHQQQLVTESRAIHERGRQLFQAVARKGGIAIHEQPPSSMAWLEPENFAMLQEVHGHITWVAACAYGVNLPKSWAFSCNRQGIRHLANVCSCPEGHPSFAGTQDKQGRRISSLTAE